MSQSTFIAGAIVAGFVLFLAAKGRLTTYRNILLGFPATAPTTAKPATASPFRPSVNPITDPFGGTGYGGGL